MHPVPVAEYGHRLPERLGILGRAEEPPDCRTDAECGEVVPGDEKAFRAPRGLTSPDGHVNGRRGDDAGEPTGLIADGFVCRVVERLIVEAAVSDARPELHQLLGLAYVGGRSQEQVVDHAEQRRVGADAEHEREHDDGGEAALTA